MESLAKHRSFRRALFGWPLRRWKALSGAARNECLRKPWTVIQWAHVYEDLLPETLANNPSLQEEQRVHLEMIPLRDSLIALAKKFGLMDQGQPAIWAMEILLEDLHQKASYPKGKLGQLYRVTEMFQAYPARTELGWTNVATGRPEEELFMIVIEILPKQPDETFDTFARRFDRTCAKARERYIHELKADEWLAVRKSEKLKWVDHLAKWQVGLGQTEIDPNIKTASQRAAFTQGIKRAAKDIGISPRKSKHDPKRRPGH